jgi:hypothetical protein
MASRLSPRGSLALLLLGVLIAVQPVVLPGERLGGNVLAAQQGTTSSPALSSPPQAVSAARASGTPAFRFAIIGDRCGGHVPGIYESVVADIERLGPAFVVSVGDHIEGYTEDPRVLSEQWTEVKGILSSFSMPFYFCPGNHDITSDGMLPAYQRETGREPCYSFDHQGVHFIILDTSRWENSVDWVGKSGYAEWLRADLEAHRDARETAVFSHKPYWYATLAEGLPDPMHEIFRAGGVDYVFNGHFHIYGAAVYDGIHYTIIGSSGGGIDAENENTGSFFQFAWCAARGDSLDWRVIHQGALLDPQTVTIADHKFFERIPRTNVHAESFADPGPGQSAALSIVLQNPSAEPWDAEIRWEAAPGWSVTPAETRISLDGEQGTNAPFTATRLGSFYPLPVMHVDLPYRAGRIYHYQGALAAKRIETATRTKKAPSIDGRLDDACWAAASAPTELASPEGSAGEIEPTVIQFAHDATHLYVAARCTQNQSPLIVRASERDGEVYREDCVGLFISADAGSRTAFQIYFNPKGTVFDQKLAEASPGNFAGDRAWNLKCRAATHRGEGEWTLEAALPLSAFSAAVPKPGDQWRINFRRKEIDKGVMADWQVPIDYNPETFGYLQFE